MDSVAKKDAKNAAQNKLKKAVDWKIFELQSILISEDVSVADVEESLVWLQPRHFTDIIEERVNDGRCGYPLCSNSLHGSNACYRVDYKEKKIYSVEQSKNYCSGECIEKAHILEKKFDGSVPYSRSAVRSLDLAAPANAGIDEVLSLLGPQAPTPTKAAVKGPSDDDERDLPPLPVYKSSVLGDTGELEVRFENGIPVTAEPASKISRTESSTGKIPQMSLTDAMDAMVVDDVDTSMTEGDTSMVEATAATVPAIHREVYVNVPSPLKSQPQRRSQPYHEHEHEEQESPNKMPQSARTAPLFSPKKSAGVSSESASSGSRNAEPMSMADMFATMNALRVKHNLENPSTAPTERKANKFMDGSLLAGRDVVEVKERKLSSAPVAETTVRAGAMGLRPGPKSVSWGKNQVKSTTDVAVSEAAPEEASAPSSVIEVRPVLKNATVVEINTTKQPEPMKLGGKRSAQSMQMGGMVMERANPTVMSEAAILRKRESAEAPAMEVVFGADGETGKGEEGENWVDVDPAELLGGGAESAMSIEGYIATVKRTMRVSPATTIKNLSHSPYTYSQAAENEAAGTADMDVEAASDAGDAEADADSYSEGEAGAGTWDAPDGEGAEDGDDEAWSDEDAAEEAVSAQPAPGKSMFLAVWSTMDELFGGSLESVFSDPQQRSAPSVQQQLAVVDAPEVFPQEHTTSRMPLALEQQNAQHAFVKLLQRGLQAAESRLDLFKLYLNLPAERALYQTVKHRLMAAASVSLQMRSNLQHSTGSSAGGGLLSDAWTLIGLLIVDAIVIKKQLGPLRRPKDSTGTAPASSNSSAEQQRDVPLEGWARVIEAQAAQVLQAAGNRAAGTGIGKLREGDLNILRSYFDYV